MPDPKRLPARPPEMTPNPVVLQGRRVRLEPLGLGHVEPLSRIGLEPTIWRWYTDPVRSPEEMRAYVTRCLELGEQGSWLSFAILDLVSGEYAGATSYLNIDRLHRRLEIGSTWIGPAWQRTHVNTEAKHLLLRHAFEELGCLRVEFKTDSLNEKSRRALLRIGAREEGTFRNHMIAHDGRIRDSIYFSIIDAEWPEVADRLRLRLTEA